MGRTFIRQAVQIAPSDYSATPSGYDDTVTPSLANYESTRPANLEDDLNSLRSAIQNILNRNGATFPTGDWYSDMTQPTALENGSKRGIDATNAALHLVEKKRVLREVWKVGDITPSLDLAILLVNDEKAKYNAHRVLTAGSVHGAADTTNVVTAADANSLASAITLANDIKAQYNAHRVLTAGSVHGAADTVNAVTSSDASTLANLLTLINEIRTDYEAHRVLTAGGVHGAADGTNSISVAAVVSTVQVHVLTAAQLPSQTTAAIGAVTTKGTVLATATSFGTAGLDEVAGSTAVSPKNLLPLVDGATRDPILVGGKAVYALFQSESATDGSTISGTTPNRVQMSFVGLNSDGDDLELVSLPSSTAFNFASIERVALEGLSEQDFLRGATVDVPAGSTVTRQVAYDNQGTTPVDLTTNAILDLEGAGLTWQVRDDLQAILFQIIEGSAGGTSSVQITDQIDTFDVNAVLNDFLNGISVDTGAAGTTINVGVSANQIDSGGALTVATGGAGDLKMDSVGGEILFDDVNRTGSTWTATAIKLSETTTEWDNYELQYGEVSLLNALVQAGQKAARVKGSATVTANVPADTDVALTTAGNLDADLPDYSRVGLVFVDDCDVYLNGELLRNGANAAANHDVYPGSTPSVGMLKFEFALRGTGSKPDQLTMIVWGS